MNRKLSVEEVQTANWENRTLFHGDNLNFMRGMNSETIDLIATDPPFNKNKDFHATPNSLAAGASFQDRWSWQDDVHQEWVDQIEDDHPALMHAIESARHAHSDGMGAYLCFMGVRLLEMHRLLKPTGSIYLHCDPTASHYLKTIMDAIFDGKNFRNEIVWHYAKGHGSPTRFRRKHDVILFYSRGGIFNIQKYKHLESQVHRFNRVDEDGRKYRINHTRDSSGKYKRFYLDDGVAADDVWSFLREPTYDQLPHNTKEKVGYPTQKPLALYERIIKASSNEGDIVLDPFCGCATTCVAAERLNRQWVGIDIWKESHALVVKRVESEVGLLANVHYAKKGPIRTDEGGP
ncbi:MAG: site-specific DNA-methyltransferase [Cytophagales bacterium]|nr:site-specific DNA-methyltransferase [Cytophagales bacterium]